MKNFLSNNKNLLLVLLSLQLVLLWIGTAAFRNATSNNMAWTCNYKIFYGDVYDQILVVVFFVGLLNILINHGLNYLKKLKWSIAYFLICFAGWILGIIYVPWSK